MKKVTVIGGSGFLGSYVSDELSKRGYQITIADQLESEYIDSQSQNFIKIDLLNIQSIKEAIKDSEFVYNFAAVAAIEDANENAIKSGQINIIGHLNVLEACRQSEQVERIVFASSAYAMSNQGAFYGISKFTAEKYTEQYYKSYGLNYTVIRYGSLYGERVSHNNYIYNLLKDALETEKITYSGNDNDLREYIHAADAAKLSVNIIESQEFENEHIILTGMEKLKRIDLITMINEILQNKLEVNQAKAHIQGHYTITPYTFNPTRAKKLIANPYIDMGQGILECIQTISEELKNE